MFRVTFVSNRSFRRCPGELERLNSYLSVEVIVVFEGVGVETG